MRALKVALLSAAVLVGAMASAAAIAHGGHHHHSRARVGVFIGAPVFYAPWYYHPPYYYYPPYYYPPTVVVPPSPPVYIEQGQAPAPAAPAQRSDHYWYYCPEAKAYYPYVRQCAGGWQRVVPQPPSS
ncbi:MAG: hypothetical protein HYS46_04770 [Betaproteobacteria bacterium]|nr:hypothetical protein [Betaproteobacteria bacterium]